jgi:hypothetical protein
MRIFICCIAAIVLVVSCKQKDKKQGDEKTTQEIKNVSDSVLVTDSTWGSITVSSDFDDLKKMYGESNIKDETICGPECVDSVDVTLVYPGSNKEFIVYWEDSLYHKKIGLIRCYTKDAPYHTTGGIKIGTTLEELLKMNGKPISFFGFGWDYGGTVFSLNHGVLENSNVRFNLDISENTTGDNAVYGDTEISSDMPAVKKLQDKIHVSELMLPINRYE